MLNPGPHRRQGHGTAVLFIHGIIGTPRHFDFLLRHVPTSWTIENLLLPGHGGSVSDCSRATMQQWSRYVAAAVDALAITADHAIFHDVSFVDGVQLDVFVYPAAHFDGDFDCDSFAQISDGHILMDTRELAAQLQARVLRHLDSFPGKTPAEIRTDVEWRRKMLLRTRRCDASGHACRGPKKALRRIAHLEQLC